jgi:exodeoxyribonuclease VII large subunit
VVQGEGAAASICRALGRLERYPGIEVIIIGRGGGSGEDLMAFNDESVVRRVAALRVPVVSAVGHEIDTTLTDLVADVRAATPSQAAELVVPDERAQLDSLRRCTMALARAMRARVLEDTMILQRLRAKVGDPRFLIAEKQQYVDDLSMRLERASRRGLARKRTAYEQLSNRLSARHPRTVIARARVRLGPLQTRLDAAMRVELSDCRALLAERSAELEGLSPLRILGRGYAIASHRDGIALRSAAEAKPGDSIQVRLHEGRLDAVVERTSSDEVVPAVVASK